MTIISPELVSHLDAHATICKLWLHASPEDNECFLYVESSRILRQVVYTRKIVSTDYEQNVTGRYEIVIRNGNPYQMREIHGGNQ